ncbi:hypothetical protein CPLU01_05432 [Colletotrichum plurivorum]|uniref:Uncharacterized protein n=1 Tax=Colletotrichum plurivorum TaxID=2175906 RepID=A0A8H6KM09_9PEZI|nr:hypothetical protein CPLU01_05432 [Colletotrichum plurivorum]
MSSNIEPPKKKRAVGASGDTPPPSWQKEFEAEWERGVGELRHHAGAKSAVIRRQGVSYGFASGDDVMEDINREASRLAAEARQAGEYDTEKKQGDQPKENEKQK